MVLTISACTNFSTSSTFLKSSSDVQRQFDSASRMACSFRKGTNESYCGCFVQVLNEIVPEEEKRLVVKGDRNGKSLLVDILLKNSKKLDGCDKHWEKDLTIPDIAVTDVAQGVLDKHAGLILNPENVDDIGSFNRPIGYEYKIQDPSLKTLSATKYKVVDIKGDKTHLVYINLPENKVYEGYIWGQGKMFYRKLKGGVESYSIASRFEECKFKLGLCKFTNLHGEEAEVFTEYRDGLWYYNLPGYSVQDRKLKIFIYDKSGLPLYYRYYILNKGTGYEEIRVESYTES